MSSGKYPLLFPGHEQSQLDPERVPFVGGVINQLPLVRTQCNETHLILPSLKQVLLQVKIFLFL